MRLLPALDRRMVILGVFAMAMTVVGCASDKSAKTTPIRFVVQADQQVNPNESGTPSPVVVRIYELKSLSAFNQAQFFDLFDNDTKVLKADLVAKREMELKPGEKRDLKRETPIETRYIGVVAGFRLGDAAQWRKTAEIVPEEDNVIIVKVTAASISIEKESGGSWWKIF